MELPAADVFRKLCNSVSIEPVEDMKIENVVGFERGIGFEFSEPIAVLVLKRA